MLKGRSYAEKCTSGLSGAKWLQQETARLADLNENQTTLMQEFLNQLAKAVVVLIQILDETDAE